METVETTLSYAKVNIDDEACKLNRHKKLGYRRFDYKLALHEIYFHFLLARPIDSETSLARGGEAKVHGFVLSIPLSGGKNTTQKTWLNALKRHSKPIHSQVLFSAFLFRGTHFIPREPAAARAGATEKSLSRLNGA
jgi:hypothetical protein